VTWAVKSSDLDAIVQKAKGGGLELGHVQAGSRRRPDGFLLAWRLTVSPSLIADGIIPFFIDWGKTPHPAEALPKGCVLVALRAEHPDANRIQSELSVLGLNIPIHAGSTPAFIATIRTPHGEVELR
jgi:hypothetical protein